jgi:uncharacterized protein YndB with AHSA1/START domain
LVIERVFKGTLQDVWESVTASESTARWIGPWSGEPGPGKTVLLTMSYEEGAPQSKVMITTCDPPHHLVVTTEDAFGQWRLELRLAQQNDSVTMTFVQHLDDTKMVGEVGPGWEYYLDMLVASRTGAARPECAAYYPSQKEYYLEAARRV